MRGSDNRSGELFSYVDLEARIRADHPLRAIRKLTDAALEALSGEFAALYSGTGRPSIAPEQLLRAMLLQGYDAADFVDELRTLHVRPHVAQNTSGRRSAIDRRTTRHGGYTASQRIRKRIEEAFGWIKGVAGLRKTKLRGLSKVDWTFTFAAAAYNLVRAPKLIQAGS